MVTSRTHTPLPCVEIKFISGDGRMYMAIRPVCMYVLTYIGRDCIAEQRDNTSRCRMVVWGFRVLLILFQNPISNHPSNHRSVACRASAGKNTTPIN